MKNIKKIGYSSFVPCKILEPYMIHIILIEPGMKIYPTDNSENGCNKIAKELEDAGFKTRIGYNKDYSRWSIAVLDNED